MALAAGTKTIVAQYEYTDDDVNKGVKEFLRQMGKRHLSFVHERNIFLTTGQARDWRRMAQV
jgi:hypothetical protein